jgi:pyruvate/2-oxoacid:ferredoxin oxidoreductase alpha subunit
MQAFNLADKYQTPVIVLVDKNICEHDQSMPVFNFADYEINRGKFTTEKQKILKDMHCPMTEFHFVLFPDQETFLSATLTNIQQSDMTPKKSKILIIKCEKE